MINDLDVLDESGNSMDSHELALFGNIDDAEIILGNRDEEEILQKVQNANEYLKELINYIRKNFKEHNNTQINSIHRAWEIIYPNYYRALSDMIEEQRNLDFPDENRPLEPYEFRMSFPRIIESLRDGNVNTQLYEWLVMSPLRIELNEMNQINRNLYGDAYQLQNSLIHIEPHLREIRIQEVESLTNQQNIITTEPLRNVLQNEDLNKKIVNFMGGNRYKINYKSF